MHPLPSSLQTLKQQLLLEANQTAALQIIEEYFLFIGVEEAKEELWLLTKAALTNELMEEEQTGKDRDNLIFSYEFLCLLLDAVNVLQDNRRLSANP